MSEIEKFRMKVSTGNEMIDNRATCKFRTLNLKKVLDIIDERIQDDNIKKILKEAANGYPHQALETFVRNLDRHISNAIKSLKEKNN